MWVSFVAAVLFWGQNTSHLQYVESSVKTKYLSASSSEVIFTCFGLRVWKRNCYSRLSLFPFFAAPSLLKLWPQLRVKCGLDSLKKEKVLPQPLSALMASCVECSITLGFFSLPCYLVGLVLCWIEDKRVLTDPSPPSLSSSSPWAWSELEC